jgi:hypothetical protein
MAYTPDSTRILGAVSGGADNQPVKVDAAGRVVITADAGNEPAFNLAKVGGAAVALGQAAKAASVPVTIASDQEQKIFGSGQQTMANSAPVVIASNQSAIPVTSSAPGAVNVMSPGEQTAIAAAATSTIVSYTPANGKTLTLEAVQVKGSGSFKWQVIYSADGIADTTVLARGYTSPGAPSDLIQFLRRYTLLGDGTKAIIVKATNIDLTLQADAAAELVGSTD